MQREQIDELRTRFMATFVSNSIIEELAQAVLEAADTNEAAVQILHTHFADFIRGWFFPTFGFVATEWVEECARRLIEGEKAFNLHDHFFTAAAGSLGAD